MKKIVIIGAGGFGREVVWLIEDINKENMIYEILGFIDENKDLQNQEINGYKVLGGIDYLKNLNGISFVVAVGNTKVKKLLVEKAIENGVIPETIIHPSVIKSERNEIGKGVIICTGNILTTNIKVEDFVTLNLACTVGHDVTLKRYSTIYPSVSISGNCSIGEESEIGTRTAIIQGVSLGKKTITGAGSVIVKSFNGNGTLIGVPGKVK